MAMRVCRARDKQVGAYARLAPCVTVGWLCRVAKHWHGSKHGHLHVDDCAPEIRRTHRFIVSENGTVQHAQCCNLYFVEITCGDDNTTRLLLHVANMHVSQHDLYAHVHPLMCLGVVCLVQFIPVATQHRDRTWRFE